MLASLFVVLLAAKVGDEVLRRLGEPRLIGEILAGIAIGPALLGIVEPSATLEAFADLGIVFLLFWIGLSTSVDELRALGRLPVQVGVLAAIVPALAGTALGLALGFEASEAPFLGAVLAATSVGIAASLIDQTGIAGSLTGKTIISGAIVCDVVALLLFAVLAGVADEDGSALEAALTIAIGVGFVAFVALGGVAALRSRPRVLERPRFAVSHDLTRSALIPAVLLCLGLAALSSLIGLAAVVGAFLAGIIVSEGSNGEQTREEIAPLYAFFPPFFFVFVGLRLDLGVFADPEALLLLVAVAVVATVSKLFGAALGARALGRAKALLVGAGLVARAEVAIVIGTVALGLGAIDDRLFSVLVAMTVLTALIAAPLFGQLADRAAVGPAGTPERLSSGARRRRRRDARAARRHASRPG